MNDNQVNSSNLIENMRAWRKTLNKDQRWCILINADPDAIAAALALKKIIESKTNKIEIAAINEITRPDNLAMLKLLHIKMRRWNEKQKEKYTNFAIVDSQPAHSPAFKDIHFDLIIDHHPQVTEANSATLCDIRPEFGATCTIMSRYLQALRLRPNSFLATAMLYGIRTDTATFERSGGPDDLRAYQWLMQFADSEMLRRITRSEYLRPWLPLFARAFRSLKDCKAGGVYAWLQTIDSSDLLVAIADFFAKIYGLKWVAVAGRVEDKVIIIFRGDGSRDVGKFASVAFSQLGSAGGHRNLARAEIPVSNIPNKSQISDFILQRLQNASTTRKKILAPPLAPADKEKPAKNLAKTLTKKEAPSPS